MKGIKQIKDYRLIKEIGRGASGVVYEAIESKTNKFFAIKAIPFEKLNNPRVLEQFRKELKSLYGLSHKNIIKIVGVEKTINNIYLILEYCNGGTLYDYAQYYKRVNKSRLPELIVQKIIKQVIDGLKFMHKNNIIHRDIKLENILINFDNESNINSEISLNNKTPKELYSIYNLQKDNFTIKIADLGYSKELEGGLGASTICGTPMTIAPEVLKIYSINGRDSKYNSAIDLWSLGAVLYELLLGVSPFIGESKEDIMRKVLSGLYQIPSNILVSIESIYLLNGLLQFFPEKRLSWEQIVFHPFITKDVKKFKFIKLNTVADTEINNDNIKENNQNMLLIDSKDCSNFLWILFKATGASLPFELSELDKDTYEEVIKDVLANQMFIDCEENRDDNDNIINNNNNNDNINYDLQFKVEYMNKDNENINNGNYNINQVNIPNKDIIKQENIQEKNFQNPTLINYANKEVFNNESDFHLFKDISEEKEKEKENGKEIEKEEEKFIVIEQKQEENVIEMDNNEKENIKVIEMNGESKLPYQIISDNIQGNNEINENKKDEIKVCNNDLIQQQKIEENHKQEEQIGINHKTGYIEQNYENIKEEYLNNNYVVLKEIENKTFTDIDNKANPIKEKLDSNFYTLNDKELLKKYLMIDSVKLYSTSINPDLKNKYINGSVDSQYSKESLNTEKYESQGINDFYFKFS